MSGPPLGFQPVVCKLATFIERERMTFTDVAADENAVRYVFRWRTD